MRTNQSVSGSPKVNPSPKHTVIKNKAKFLKNIPMPTIRAIINAEADTENKSQPRPSATIK